MSKAIQCLMVITITVSMALSVSSCSSYGKAKGRVLDKITGKPVSGATVAIKGSAVSALTDKDGYYLIKEIVPGSQSIIITKTGYCQAEISGLTFAKGTITNVTEVFLLLNPPKIGIFEIDSTKNSLIPIPYVSTYPSYPDYITYRPYGEANFTGALKKYPADVSFVIKTINKIDVEAIRLFNTVYKPMENYGFFGTIPASWGTSKRVSDASIEKITEDTFLLKANMQDGIYAIDIQTGERYEDWVYFFEVGHGSANTNSANTAEPAVDTLSVAN